MAGPGIATPAFYELTGGVLQPDGTYKYKDPNSKSNSPTKSSAPDAKSASRSKRSSVEADRETGQIRRTSRNRSTILSPLKSSSNKSSILGD